jgi:signal transduction histidine kinase
MLDNLVDNAVKFTPERGNISISIVKIVESEIGKGSIFTVSIPVEQTTSFQSKAY